MTITVRPAPAEWRNGKVVIDGASVPTQGSKTYGTTKEGKAFGRENKSTELGVFRAAVAAAVALDYPGLSRLEPLFPAGHPVALRVMFRMPLTKRQAKAWRTNASPVWHCVAPDGDKQMRATLDALTAAHIWADDGQVCWGQWVGVRHPVVGVTIEWSPL